MRSEKGVDCLYQIILTYRKNILENVFSSVPLRGSETWTIRKKKIVAFEVWCLSGMLNVNWIENAYNDRVFQKAIETRSLVKSLKYRRTITIGYSLWYNSFSNGKI